MAGIIPTTSKIIETTFFDRLFPSESAALRIKECENNPSPEILTRNWKFIRDSKEMDIGGKLMAALVIFTLGRSVPEKFLGLFNETYKLSRSIKKNGLKEKLEVNDINNRRISISKMSQQEIELATYLIIIGQIEPQDKPTVLAICSCYFGSNALHPSKSSPIETFYEPLMSVEDSQSDESLPSWIADCRSLHSTIALILTKTKLKTSCPDVYKRLNDNNAMIKDFSETEAINLKVGTPGLPIFWRAWLEEVNATLAEPTYLQCKGIEYHLLKGVSEKATSILRSYCKVSN